MVLCTVNLKNKNMTVKELKEYLSKFEDNQEVMIRDGFNGGGDLRVINCKTESVMDFDDEGVYDNKELLGTKVVELGFGNY